jgi:hypothetical protein
VPSTPRNKNATWRPIGDLGWPKPRALHELRNGLKFRTWPPGHEHEINWHDPYFCERLDLATSTLRRVVLGERKPPILASRQIDVGIEVWDGDMPSQPAPPANAPAAASVRRRVSAADEEQCFRDILGERPDDPPTESWLLEEMEWRLGAPPVRKRVRILWTTLAPKWKRPRGYPLMKKPAV